MTETYSDKGSLYLGISRWYGYAGLPYAATMEISTEKIEFRTRIFLRLLKRVYVFQKIDIYSIEQKKGWWVLKDGFIIEHRKDYPMYICYTTWNFDIVKDQMNKLGWQIND